MRRAQRSVPPPLSISEAEDRDAPDDYLQPHSGGFTVGPLIALAALAVVIGGFWLLDPLGWRRPHTPDAAETSLAAAGKAPAAPLAASASLPPDADTSASAIAWAKANRTSPVELRGLVTAYPGTSASESARSLLRVLDAQAWADAVTADTEKAYTAYIQSFPADGDIPGAMAAAAQERLASLSSERLQAIADVQRALVAAKLYKGKADGQLNDSTIKAMRSFAQGHNRSMIDPRSSAPRDLRNFADFVSSGGRSAPAAVVSATPPAAPPNPQPAAPSSRPPAAAPAAASTAAPSATSAATSAAAAADRARVQQAEEARKAAQKQAAEDAAAAADLQAKDAADFAAAKAGNTAAAYQAYLAAHPDGASAADARAAVARLSRPAAYVIAQLPPQVRQAVEAARQAQAAAAARAAAARNTAARADAVAAAARAGAAGTQILTAADGAHYESQVSGGAPNGLGVKVAGGAAKGDTYRGELRNGLGVGLGVYEFADNPNNARSAALRYEGDHAADLPNGLGVTYWKNGDTFAGQQSPAGPGGGVMSFADGQRYEGEMSNGRRSGYGVVWSADGQVVMAGRFENGALAEPTPTQPPAQ
jgi:hypothetical protein